MQRQSNRVVDGLIPGYGKIRKRGCSSSPSSSTKFHNYRFKRAIMVGKTRVASGSRSSTPAPSWRMTPASKCKLGGGTESPNYDGGGGRSRPVSARKLAATLWEMNEMPSPQNSTAMKREKETARVRERTNRPVHTSGSFPPHLSDPSHSPVSQRMDRFGTGSHRRISTSHKPRLEDNKGEIYDSLSNVSSMEIENRSRAQSPNASVNSIKPRLKEVSYALMTSKELLKIIHRMWAHDNLPSSSMSLISALHTELERARLQVNQIIRDQSVDHNEIDYLLKCFAEEKALWKSKERRAIESMVDELAVEKKLRRRSESLNKKLGQELAEMNASFAGVLEELESEKRAREIMEQVCDELAVEDRDEAEKLKRESVKVHESKHQFEEKNAVVEKLRNQLEAFLGNGKKKGRKDEHFIDYLNRSKYGGTRLNEEQDGGEVEDDEDASGESDLHSIQLSMDNNNKSFKWNHAHNANKVSLDDEKICTDLINAKTSRKSTSSIQETFVDIEKQTPRRSHGDDLLRYKSVKGLRDRILTTLKPQMSRDFDNTGHGSGSKSRGETICIGRRSKK